MIHDKTIESATNNFDDVFPRTAWEWLLLLFIVGLMTLSNLPGLSRLMVIGGLVLSWVFLIYFLYLRLKLQPEIIIYLVWIGWSMIGALKTTDSGVYLVQLQTVIQIAVLMFLVAGITALRPSLSTVMLAVALGGMIVAISGYYTDGFLIGSEIRQTERVTGLTSNPNIFAYHVLFVIIGSFYFWEIKSSLLWRIFLSAIIALCFMGIIYSGSRAGYFGVIGLLILWVLFCQLKQLFKKSFITLSTVVIVAGGIYYTTDYVISSTLLGQRFESKNMQRGSDFRTQMYLDGFNMIKTNPLFGVGLANFRLLSSTGNSSHSDYIAVAASTGVVGFIMYFSIYIALWRRLNRIRGMTTNSQLLYRIGLLKAAILTILLLAIGTMNVTSKLTWLFLAGAIGYSWSIEQALFPKDKEE